MIKEFVEKYEAKDIYGYAVDKMKVVDNVD